MSEVTIKTPVPNKFLFGRKVIYSSEPVITDVNVVKVVEQAYLDHLTNRSEIEYLWEYFKGKQPSLFRKRELRDELTQKICENRANELVSFKVGYIAGKPIVYVSSAKDDNVSATVEKLNDLMRVQRRNRSRHLHPSRSLRISRLLNRNPLRLRLIRR